MNFAVPPSKYGFFCVTGILRMTKLINLLPAKQYLTSFVASVLCISVVACSSESAREGDDNVAVALGDSFISGEGAEAFISGDGAANYQGVPPNPLFSATNSTNPYFCHVSDNASISVANLPGIDRRVNLACSGADPVDLKNANQDFVTVSGAFATELVEPQLEQLWTVAGSDDVDLILITMGANNSINSFASVLSFCHSVFMADAAGGPAGGVAVNEVTDTFNPTGNLVFPSVETALDNNGCVAADFFTQAQLNTISDEYEEGLKALLAGMTLLGYEKDSWKLVVQGYASPYPPVPHAEFLQESGRDDDNRFAALARERYAAGCPVHELSMAESDNLAQLLTSIASDVVQRLRADHPDYDIVFMDVQRAFDGGRLCETATSPTGALWNPIWFRDATNNIIAREIPSPFGGTFAGQWAQLALACGGAGGSFARCQDSAHPNQNGHAALGRCLSLTVDYSDANSTVQDIECRRDPANGAMSVNAL